MPQQIVTALMREFSFMASLCATAPRFVKRAKGTALLGPCFPWAWAETPQLLRIDPLIADGHSCIRDARFRAFTEQHEPGRRREDDA